jgi:hypothetical protein
MAPPGLAGVKSHPVVEAKIASGPSFYKWDCSGPSLSWTHIDQERQHSIEIRSVHLDATEAAARWREFLASGTTRAAGGCLFRSSPRRTGRHGSARSASTGWSLLFHLGENTPSREQKGVLSSLRASRRREAEVAPLHVQAAGTRLLGDYDEAPAGSPTRRRPRRRAVGPDAATPRDDAFELNELTAGLR